MATTGSAKTTLIVLRGNSGSGKSTVAQALRESLDGETSWIEQDYFTRVVLGEKERAGAANIELLDAAARLCLDRGFTVILDGIFNASRYGAMLEGLFRDHGGVTVFYAFDLAFDETLRRHTMREKETEFGEADMRDWFHGWQPLPFVAEQRITASESLEMIIDRIAEDIDGGGSALTSSRPSGRPGPW